jgi:hypothetical protein
VPGTPLHNIEALIDTVHAGIDAAVA